jgi:hypothetical protein
MAEHEIQIQGETFRLSPPYEEGHVLNAAEASQLNQTWAEGVGNNLRKKIKEAKEAGSFDAAAFQAQLDAYAEKYQFGVRQGGGGGGVVAIRSRPRPSRSPSIGSRRPSRRPARTSRITPRRFSARTPRSSSPATRTSWRWLASASKRTGRSPPSPSTTSCPGWCPRRRRKLPPPKPRKHQQGGEGHEAALPSFVPENLPGSAR